MADQSPHCLVYNHPVSGGERRDGCVASRRGVAPTASEAGTSDLKDSYGLVPTSVCLTWRNVLTTATGGLHMLSALGHLHV